MATFGSISEFNEDDDWLQYTERLVHYFEANGIEEEKKQKAILLSVCGSKTYSLMRNLLAPAKPGDKKYEELVELVRKHRNPPPSEIVQRFKFHTRRRKAAESVSEYVAELRKLYPYMIKLTVNGQPQQFELDTGAAVSVVDESTFNYLNVQRNLKVQQSEDKFRTYSGEVIKAAGVCVVTVKYHNQVLDLPLRITKGKRPSLLGRNWIKVLQLEPRDIARIFTLDQSMMMEINQMQSASVEASEELHNIVDKYPTLFTEGLGTFKGVEAKIYVEAEEKPLYFKARPVPYALKEKIEKELDKLQAEGTIEPIEFSEWAAPIVPIVKSDNEIRICGDYKVTVNKVSKLDNYPIPKTDDLYATLGGGEEFTKLDLSQAYQQIKLEENSKKYVTVNTHKGLYRYNRLPYGVSSAPGIFQRSMENLLQGLPRVLVRVDDILITGRNRKEHLATLDKVLHRLAEAGLKLKRRKCTFLAQEVVYLGYRIDKEGIHPVSEKVKAIKEAPEPTSVTELKSYLGMLNYYGRFMKNLSTILAPLHQLLQKKSTWSWGPEQQKSFNKSKELLCSADVLVHFDSSTELILACDASPYGIGAVLAHRMENGEERPIGYASRTLNAAEKNYSQLEKEGLAIVFAVKKFHQYLFGHHFTIVTDHKPLLGLFGESKAVPTLAASRIQRWALTLAAYEYTLVFKAGINNSNADCLSRLPLSECPGVEKTPVPADTIMLMDLVNSTVVTVKHIRTWTRTDPVLSKVLGYIQCGWPNHSVEENLKPFFSRKEELTSHDGCILWGNRVVIPRQGRTMMINELHQTHPGIVRMKSLARGYIWWPGMDAELETFVKKCTVCQQMQPTPPKAHLHPWEWPELPWTRIHVDYAGPFLGKMFLIVIDAHSKWIEVEPVSDATSTSTIEKLRRIFAVHGLPEILVSDNGSVFTSEEFGLFLSTNGVNHVKTAPYHPASNGLAERAVRTFKEAMKKNVGGSIETRLSRFLFRYRITPQSSTGTSPAELLMGRRLKTHLDLVHPNLSQRVKSKQTQQKEYHDRHAQDRDFSVTDSVYVKNFSSGPNWIPATVREKSGPVSCTVELSDGRIVRRHQDHIRRRATTTVPEMSENPSTMIKNPSTMSVNPPTMSENPSTMLKLPTSTTPVKVPVEAIEETLTPRVLSAISPGRSAVEAELPKSCEVVTSVPDPVTRTSRRGVKAPSYLKDYVC